MVALFCNSSCFNHVNVSDVHVCVSISLRRMYRSMYKLTKDLLTCYSLINLLLFFLFTFEELVV